MVGENPVVVIDNGGYQIKAGVAGARSPHTFLNAAVKPRHGGFVVAEQCDKILDWSGAQYSRPVDKGYVTDWKLEQRIWDRILGKHNLNVSPKSATLVVTEPLFNPVQLRARMDETVFETLQFERYARVYSPSLAVRGFRAESMDNTNFGRPCSVVVDSGYSFTHVAPMIDCTPVNYATQRIDVGGKLLTNLLKETTSYRAWNMMDEVALMDDIKEQLCFVSTNFERDLRHTQRLHKNRILRHFVMPDGSAVLRGYVKEDREKEERAARKAADAAAAAAASAAAVAAGGGEEKEESEKGTSDDKDKDKASEKAAADKEKEKKKKRKRRNDDSDSEDTQLLQMNNERMTIPETLFSPGDIGIPQMGISECVIDAVNKCPEELRGLMLQNIVIVGGNAALPGFADRLAADVRSGVDADTLVKVWTSQRPTLTAWHGGSALGVSLDLANAVVTRAEWQEHGENICLRRFCV
jgi:actin-related protein 6